MFNIRINSLLSFHSASTPVRLLKDEVERGLKQMHPYTLAVRSVIIGTAEILLLLQQGNLSIYFYFTPLHHHFNQVSIHMP
jgi:hypothetical protein